MMVEPPVLDGTDNDDMMVEPEVPETEEPIIEEDVEEPSVKPVTTPEIVANNNSFSSDILPQTGDSSVIIYYIGLGMISLALLLRNRKFN